MVGAGLEVIDWFAVAGELGDGGWVRLRAAVNEEARTVLTEAAPPTWSLLPEIEGRVRQGGWSSGVFFDHAVLSVQEFGRNICEDRPGALFRVWRGDVVTEWETDDGDLVILRGRGWPTEKPLCPVHEVESPRVGERMTLTLRHNVGGPGADYFARDPADP